MDPVAYAEILVEYQWTANGVREVVTDPAAPWPDLPAGALDLPAVRPPKTWDDDHGDRWLAFAAVRRYPDAPDQGVEVTLWSVRVPRDGPASWVCQRS